MNITCKLPTGIVTIQNKDGGLISVHFTNYNKIFDSPIKHN